VEESGLWRIQRERWTRKRRIFFHLIFSVHIIFLASGVLEGFFNFFPGIAPSCHLKGCCLPQS
jgi:hypothetical protein